MCSRGFAEGGLSVEEAFVVLPAVLDALTSAQWWRLSDGELAEAVRVLARCESRSAAAGVGALGEAMSRGLPAAAGARTGGQWLRGLVPVTPSAATARAGLAEALHPPSGLGGQGPVDGLAPTRVAFAAGEISPGHAGVIVRTMDAVDAIPPALGVAGVPGPGGVDEATRAEAQGLLLAAARVVDPGQLGRAGLRLRHTLDPDAGQRLARDEDRQQELREAWLVQEGTGMWRLHGYLPPVAGACLAAALDPLAVPEPAVDGSPDARSGRMRTADALATLAELSLAARAGAPGGLPRRAGAATRLVLTADLATLTADLTSKGAQAGAGFGRLETGEPGGWEISPLATQVLACGAEVVPILLDAESGRPLDVGDTMYPFPAKIRRAIEQRDRACTFPGCSAKPPWCHTHHLIPYRRSEWTAEANGALLCGRHHRHVHAHGWTGQIIDGHIHWRQPDPNKNNDRGEVDRDDGGDVGGDEATNAHQQRFERALRHLAQRWLARNHDPDGDGPDPSDTS